MSVTSVLKKTGKWLLRIFLVIILLILLIWGLLQTQWGKNVMKDQAVRYLKKKLKTEVAIQSFTVDCVGLIEFFDPLHPEDSTTKKNKPAASASSYGMSMNIRVTPSSTVVIMMDEVTGDHLKLKGNADLSVTKEPGGQMYLSGRYTLD